MKEYNAGDRVWARNRFGRGSAKGVIIEACFDYTSEPPILYYKVWINGETKNKTPDELKPR